MGSRGASVVLSRANRIKAKLQSALEATALEIDDVSYQHSGHAAVRETAEGETHFNVPKVRRPEPRETAPSGL
jgi:stress-induced morphogen